MASEVILPRVDMDMETGSISHWLVGEGDTVNKGQVLFEIETDKAAMEVEAEAAGIIRGINEVTGERMPVGTVVAWICSPDEDFTPPDTRSAETANETAAAPANGSTARPAQVTSGRNGDEGRPAAADESNVPARSAVEKEPISRPRATPLARRTARRNSIDLTQLNGSGPRGRILNADVATALGVGRKQNAPCPPKALPQQDLAGSALHRLRDGSGTPLVLIHGFGSEAGSWRPLLAHLGLSLPVLALELPGHGQSEMQERTDFESLVAAAEEAMREAKLDSVHLIGHSLGGAVSVRIAASGVFDIRSLTLIAPAGLGPAINGEFLEGFVEAEGEPATAAWMKLLVHSPDVITPGFVRATVKVKSRQREAQSRMRQALFPSGTQVFDVRADLGRITGPVRMLVGCEDRIIPSHQVQSLPGTVALHRLDGTGHMPHIEAPELTGRLIRQNVLSAG